MSHPSRHVFTYRPAEAADHSQLADMFMELQKFHKLPFQTRETILNDIVNRPPSFEIFVAEDHDGTLCGFALVSVYPGPGIACGWYLKELYVTEPARAKGVGQQLINTLVQVALSRGYERIDWVTTRDNAKAMAFYDRIGAKQTPEKVCYRLNAEGLLRLAKQ